jgi:hypothetical protein
MGAVGFTAKRLETNSLARKNRPLAIISGRFAVWEPEFGRRALANRGVNCHFPTAFDIVRRASNFTITKISAESAPLC